MKLVIFAIVCFAPVLAWAEPSSSVDEYLQEHSYPAMDYVLAKATTHRVSIIGEAHWIKQDAAFVASLIPALGAANIDLAVEVFPASEQSRIDKLLTSPNWSDAAANAIMRAANWPYQEYRDLLHAGWSTNQSSVKHITILGLGPPADWRSTLLPTGKTYDSFMADVITRHVSQSGRGILVYTGMHHAFTRYYQAELSYSGVATAYMDRMGNMLMRRFGEQVFLIALHKPIWCGSPAEPSYCLPFAGRIDCAASRVGHPVGFDVVASPIADLRFEPEDYYAYAHPALRFVDYTDGYVVLSPINAYRPTTIIPLDEYAPSDSSFAQVMKKNPFTDERDVNEIKLREIWAEQLNANRDFHTSRRWKHLSKPVCGAPEYR